MATLIGMQMKLFDNCVSAWNKGSDSNLMMACENRGVRRKRRGFWRVEALTCTHEHLQCSEVAARGGVPHCSSLPYARARGARANPSRGAADLFLANSFCSARRRRWPRRCEIAGQLLSRSFSLSLGAWVPSAAPDDQTDPLEPAGRRFANFVLVLHRALPDLQRMKLCYSAAASSAPRSVFSWCD